MGRPPKPSKRRPRLTKSQRGRDGRGGEDENVGGRPIRVTSLEPGGKTRPLYPFYDERRRWYVMPSGRFVMVETLSEMDFSLEWHVAAFQKARAERMRAQGFPYD